MNTITAFSYSRYATWTQCPRKAYYQYVERRPEGPPSEAMERGSNAHEICAAIYEGKWPTRENMPVTEAWRHLLSRQKNFYGPDLEAELQLAFDKDWNRTAWFDKQTVYRAAFDGMAYTPGRDRLLQIYEHKTGRQRPEQHLQQAGWYAGLSTLVVPDAEIVKVDIHYLDLPAGTPKSVLKMSYSHVLAEEMLNRWKEWAAEMMADDEFPTRAGPHCRWCPYRNSAGGPCALG